MCKRNCVYRGAILTKQGRNATCCNYSTAAARANSRKQTRMGQVRERLERKHPEWPEHKLRERTIRELTEGDCLFFLRNGQGKPEDGMKHTEKRTEEKPVAARKPEKQTRKRTLWDKQEELLTLYKQGLNDFEIAEKIGVTNNAIYYWRKQNDLPANVGRGRHSNPKKIDREKLQALHDQGYTDKEIGAALHCSPMTVLNWRRQNHLLKNEPREDHT